MLNGFFCVVSFIDESKTNARLDLFQGIPYASVFLIQCVELISNLKLCHSEFNVRYVMLKIAIVWFCFSTYNDKCNVNVKHTFEKCINKLFKHGTGDSSFRQEKRKGNTYLLPMFSINFSMLRFLKGSEGDVMRMLR